MSQPHRAAAETAFATAGERVVRLSEILTLVQTLAGRQAPFPRLVDCKAVNRARASAPTIVQWRIDDLVARSAALATSGIEALLAGHASPAAIGLFADELEREIAGLEVLLARA